MTRAAVAGFFFGSAVVDVFPPASPVFAAAINLAGLVLVLVGAWLVDHYRLVKR